METEKGTRGIMRMVNSRKRITLHVTDKPMFIKENINGVDKYTQIGGIAENNNIYISTYDFYNKGESTDYSNSLLINPDGSSSNISINSEDVLPKRHVFEQLKSRFTDIELLYDNDYDKSPNWGRIFADKFAKEFGLVDSFIPDKYQTKDFSDLVKNYGKEKAKHILLYETLLPF